MTKLGAHSGPESIRLLAADEAGPVIVLNAGAPSPFLLLGDHAGAALPRILGDLGLSATERGRHIALDIGVAGLGALLSARLDATFIQQRYSRLVIDCNRPPADETSIPAISDGIVIPGNAGLRADAMQARRAEIYQPYQDEIARALDLRVGRPTVLVSLHSFTPVMQGRARPWRLGVLHRGDSPFSSAVLRRLAAELGAAVGDNQPYRMDETDHTVPLHADLRRLDYLELEVRQDLLATPRGQSDMAQWLAQQLEAALRDVSAGEGRAG